MPLPALYVTRLLPEPVMAAIRRRFHLILEPTALPPAPDRLRAGIQQAQAVICTLTERIDRPLLDAAPTLKIIANYAVGYNNIDVAAAQAKGIVVTNTPDVLTDATADLAWALLLAVARRIPEGDRLVKDGAWTGWEPTQLLGAEVYGRTLGIIGMGRIGQAVARRAAGFDMTVLYARFAQRAGLPTDQRWRQVSLDEVLAQSDFVSLHVPLTVETRHLIGERALSLMKPTAFLINTSRGAVLDERAVVTALRQGRLAGAGLDVYEQEPALSPGLAELSQVVTLPHLGSATMQARVRMGMLCLENVSAVLEGKPPLNPVRA
jgi:glyoxylate reductase